MDADTSTPEAAFAAAQHAMEHGDWEALFALLTTTDLRRLASMGLGLIGGPHAEEARSMLSASGIGDARLRELDALTERLATSAAGLGAGIDLGTEEMLARSTAHRSIVQALEAERTEAVKEVEDLPRLVAAIERFRRATEGGGSVSSQLFVHESLVDAVVDGNTARGLRRHHNGTTDPVRFARARGGWRISLLGR